MSNQSNAGTLSPRELELVGRVLDRLCTERGYKAGTIDAEHLATQALTKFQSNRDLDEAELEAILRQE